MYTGKNLGIQPMVKSISKIPNGEPLWTG